MSASNPSNPSKIPRGLWGFAFVLRPKHPKSFQKSSRTMGICFLLWPKTTKILQKLKQNARFRPQALQIPSKTNVKSMISASSPPKSFQTENKIKDFSLKPSNIRPKPNQNQRFQPQALQYPSKTKSKSKISASSPPISFQNQIKIKHFSLKPFQNTSKTSERQIFQRHQ